MRISGAGGLAGAGRLLRDNFLLVRRAPHTSIRAFHGTKMISGPLTTCTSTQRVNANTCRYTKVLGTTREDTTQFRYIDAQDRFVAITQVTLC